MPKIRTALAVCLLLSALPAMAEPISRADYDAAVAQASAAVDAMVAQDATTQQQLSAAQAALAQAQATIAARDALVSKLRGMAPPPTLTLIAAPSSIQLGETSTLALTAINTETCTPTGWDMLNPVVKPQADTTYKVDCIGWNGVAVSAQASVAVMIPPPAPTPIPVPNAPRVVHGTTPSDGYISGTSSPAITSGWNFIVPSIEHGQRLSGTVTISPVVLSNGINPIADQSPWAGVPKRLLVDGVPQPGWTMDTTQYPDGTHVVAVQVMDATGGAKLYNGSRIAVFNNTGVPYTSKKDQAVVSANLGSWQNNSLAWARVDVLPPLASPIGHAHALHPLPTEADRQRMVTDPVWWVEGLTHQASGLYINYPMLVKNPQGDYFVRQWVPEWYDKSLDSSPKVACAPAFDGPRGIAMLSPYTTMVAGRKVLPSGMTGFVGVDIAGRVVDVEITGAVTTIFGPRSVADTVQTDPWYTDFNLARRVAAGEKEFVGNGPFLKAPQDIAVVDDDILLIADEGANQVSRLSRSAAKIISSTPAAGVTSVWYGFGSEWWITKGTVWRDGAVFASVPDAYWVRGDETRGTIYVLADTTALYTVDPVAATVTQRTSGKKTSAGQPWHLPFVFASVDYKGNIGPQGRVYLSAVTFENNNLFHYIDPDTWTEATWVLKFANRGNGYGSKQASIDQWGHYLWGLAIHDAEAVWVSAGIANSSWRFGVAHLGQQPVPDPLSTSDYGYGEQLAILGQRDKTLGLAAIFGHYGAGGLGYTVDTLRNGTITDFRTLLDPLLPSSYSAAQRQQEATYFWYQRSRPHFPPAPAP